MKRIISLIIIAVVLLNLVGCGNSVIKNNEKLIIANKWYAQEYTNSAYSKCYSITFKDDGTFKLYNEETEKNAVTGDYSVKSDTKITMKVNAYDKAYNPPSFWSFSNDTEVSYSITDAGLTLIIDSVVCNFYSSRGRVKNAALNTFYNDLSQHFFMLENKGLLACMSYRNVVFYKIDDPDYCIDQQSGEVIGTILASYNFDCDTIRKTITFDKDKLYDENYYSDEVLDAVYSLDQLELKYELSADFTFAKVTFEDIDYTFNDFDYSISIEDKK